MMVKLQAYYMVKTSIIFTILIVFCISCTSTANNAIPDTTDGNHELETGPENSGSESFSYGNTQITANSASIENTINGNTIELTLLNTEDGFNFYEEGYISKVYHDGYSFSGNSVSGTAWTYYHRNQPIFGSDIQLEGTLATSTPIGLVSYQGNYFAAFPARGTDTSYVFTPIHLEVDYETGVIVGFDHRRLDIINIDGIVDGNTIEGVIYGPQGTLEFEGGVFGPQGEEIAGVFESGEIVGFIYGEYDEERTELIN